MEISKGSRKKRIEVDVYYIALKRFVLEQCVPLVLYSCSTFRTILVKTICLTLNMVKSCVIIGLSIKGDAELRKKD